MAATLRSLVGPLLLLAAALLPAGADERGVLYREVTLASRLDRGGLSLERGTWVAFEWYQRFAGAGGSGWAPELLDLYGGLAVDPGQAPRLRWQEGWLQWVEPAADTRVRVGRLPLPFGLTPTLDLRGEVLMPLLSMDLGTLREWGIATRVHARDFVYEAAATWNPDGSHRRPARRPLFTARLGVPAFRDLHYGLSTLYGTTRRGDDRAAAWRLAGDIVYLHDEPYTSVQGEFHVGGDGDRSLWGWLARGTHILRAAPRWQLLTQVRRWQDGTDRRETALGVGHSLPHLWILHLLWRTGHDGTSLFVQLHRHAR